MSSQCFLFVKPPLLKYEGSCDLCYFQANLTCQSYQCPFQYNSLLFEYQQFWCIDFPDEWLQCSCLIATCSMVLQINFTAVTLCWMWFGDLWILHPLFESQNILTQLQYENELAKLVFKQIYPIHPNSAYNMFETRR